MLTASSPERF